MFRSILQLDRPLTSLLGSNIGQDVAGSLVQVSVLVQCFQDIIVTVLNQMQISFLWACDKNINVWRIAYVQIILGEARITNVVEEWFHPDMPNTHQL